MTNQPPPPSQGGYPPPPPQGGYPPPPPPRRLPATATSAGGYPPPPPAPVPAIAEGGYPPSTTAAAAIPFHRHRAGHRHGVAFATADHRAAMHRHRHPVGRPAIRRRLKVVTRRRRPAGFPPAGGPGFGQSYNVGDAFSWAWNKFSKNAGPLIVATLVYGLVVVVLQAIISSVSAAVSPSDYSSYSSDATSFSFSYGMSGAGSIIVSIIGWFALTDRRLRALQSAYIGGTLDIANGQQVRSGLSSGRGTSAMSSSRV